MQPQSQREPAQPVIGRDDLVTRMVEAITAGPTLVLIEGEPGIGKTRLLREVLGHPDIADRRQVVGDVRRWIGPSCWARPSTGCAGCATGSGTPTCGPSA